MLTVAAPAAAKIVTVGPNLSAPATLDTDDGLGYTGTNTAVPPTPQYPNGIVHTPHFGADTAIWNAAVDGHSAAMPHAGQAVRIRLEGCAVPSAGPPPLDQIHFQTLNPQGGGVKVELTSASFTIPVCGVGGASGSTISTYTPVNLCVGKGDYVGFNDEGGYEEPFYRSGVPYRVLGSLHGASLVSFIRAGGTNNGAFFSPSYTGSMEGWAASSNVALMMQVELGTGSDARYVCATGTKDKPRVLPAMDIRPQTDGINRARVVGVAIYCRPASGCHGGAVMQLLSAGRARTVGSSSFSLPGDATTRLNVRVTPEVLRLIRRDNGVVTRVVAHIGHQAFVQTVRVNIL